MQLNLDRGGRGEPLVLLHGIGSRWGMWTPVLESLRRDYDVIALDLPGFGDSPMPPPGTPPGPESLTTLVTESLAELGVDRFHVAGNSLGGLIALTLARRGIALSATAFSPGGFADRAETVLATALLRVAVRSSRMMAPHADVLLARPRARTLLLSTFFAHPDRVPAAAAAADMRAMAGAPWFDATLPTLERWVFPEGDGIEVPLTVAWGAKDRLLLPRQARAARTEFPQARFEQLPDCGHVPTWDDPIAVASLIAATAQSSPGSPGSPASPA